MSVVDKIVDHKALTKKRLNALRRAYLYAIYFGILNKQEWFKIHDKLLKETIKFKKYKNIDVSKMYLISEYVFRESQKYRDDSNAGLALFLFLDAAYHLFAKPLNKIVNAEENVLKSEYLTNMINDARESGQIFYLCSKHGDSAKDHVNWQGKIYVDEKWDWYNKDRGVLEFLNDHRIPTIQWVIGEPVYMVTRPNCRHFFKPIPVSDVLKNDAKELLNKYKMRFASGYKAIESKAQAIKEKLEFYKQLYSVSKGQYIAQKIKYYENYLQNME